MMDYQLRLLCEGDVAEKLSQRSLHGLLATRNLCFDTLRSHTRYAPRLHLDFSEWAEDLVLLALTFGCLHAVTLLKGLYARAMRGDVLPVAIAGVAVAAVTVMLFVACWGRLKDIIAPVLAWLEHRRDRKALAELYGAIEAERVRRYNDARANGDYEIAKELDAPCPT